MKNKKSNNDDFNIRTIIAYSRKHVKKYEIYEYFSKFGSDSGLEKVIKKVKIMKKSKKNPFFRLKVEFFYESCVKRVFEKKNHSVGGVNLRIHIDLRRLKQIDVKKLKIFIKKNKYLSDYDFVKYFVDSLVDTRIHYWYDLDRNSYSFSFNKSIPYNFCHGHHQVKNVCFDVKILTKFKEINGENQRKFFYVHCNREVEIEYSAQEIKQEDIEGYGEIEYFYTIVLSRKSFITVIGFVNCESFRKFYRDNQSKYKNISVRINKSIKISQIQDVISILIPKNVYDYEIVKYFSFYGLFNYRKVLEENKMFFFFEKTLPKNFLDCEHNFKSEKNEKIELSVNSESIESYFNKKEKYEDYSSFKNFCKREIRSLKTINVSDYEKEIGLGIVESSEPEISVLQYNILQELATDYIDNFVYARKDYDSVLRWEKRKIKIIRKLTLLNPDIITLQEMEPIINLPKYGYKLFTYVNHGKCGILYKENKFNVLEKRVIDLDKFCEHKTYRIALFLVLEEKKSKERFVVVNAHFHHVEKYSLQQSISLMKEIEKIRKKYSKIIFCGDLNNEPGSELYKIFRKEFDTSYEEEEGKYTFFSMYPRHIDYIFYCNFELIELLDLPKEKLLLPNKNQGSDHVFLYAKFIFK